MINQYYNYIQHSCILSCSFVDLYLSYEGEVCAYFDI